MCDLPLLASASMDGTIRFWDIVTQKSSHILSYKDSQINTMCITPDGTQLVAAGYQNLRMYSIRDPTPNGLHTFSVHDQKNVTAVGFHADGRWMYTGGEEGSTKIWDMRASQLTCSRVFQVNSPVHSVALHPNQVEMLIADSAGALYVWDLRTDHDDLLVTEVDMSEYIVHVDIDRAGRQCAAVTNRGNLFLWNISHSGIMMPMSVTPQAHFQTSPGAGSITEIVTDPNKENQYENYASDSDLMANPNNVPAVPLQPGLILPSMAANITQQNLTFPQQQIYQQQQGYVMVPPGYLNSPHSPVSMTANTRNGVRIAAHSTFILKCRFRPDGLAVATTSADQTTKMWSTNNHKLLNSYSVPKNKWVWDCAFTNDSNYMINASSDGMLRMWNLNTSDVVRNFHGHSLGITAMAFRDCA